MIIDTLGDLWKRFDMYPTYINYFIEDESINGWLYFVSDMREFFDKYKDYEVRDFHISSSSESLDLFVTIKKGETEDE